MTYYTPLVVDDDLDPETINSRLEELRAAIRQFEAGELTQTTPDIDSLINATHDHEDAAGGGQLTVDAIDAESSTSGQVMASDGNGGFEWSDSVGALLGYTDTPSTFAGKAGAYVRINQAGSALEFSLLNRDSYEVDEGSEYSTTSDTFVDIDATNLALTIETGGGDVLVCFTPCVVTSSTAANINFDFEVDGTRVAGEGGILTTRLIISTSQTLPCLVFRLLTGLAAGSHTIKVQWKTSDGTATIRAGATASEQVHPQLFALEVL